MEKNKKIIITVAIVVVIGIISVVLNRIMGDSLSFSFSLGNGKGIQIGFGSGNWIKEYETELDQFFGEGNWECISEEGKESNLKSEKNVSRYGTGKEKLGGYKNWKIRFKNRNGEEETTLITNEVLIINNDRHGLSSPERYNEKQAFYLELMDVSLELVADELFNDIVRSELTEEEANSVYVAIHRHGNPKPEFYDALAKEEWFTVDKVTAEDYLSNELHRFYIGINIDKYRLSKLTEQEQKNVFDSFEKIEKGILDKYGDKASFEMYFDKEHKVEYRYGVKE